MTRTVPFTVLEEATLHLEEAYTPWNVQLEIETGVTIDVDRLREAARAACAVHPLARARKQSKGSRRTNYVWEIPEQIEDVPLEVVAELDGETRSTFYTEPLSLDSAPPFRLLVARSEDGDRLCLCANHVAVDGVGALRLLRSICVAYRGDSPEADPVDLETSREAFESIRPDSLGDRLETLGSAARRLRSTIDPPARITPQGATGELTWGFVDRRLDADLTERLIENRPEGASVNDLLLAALHLTIDRWNSERGNSPGKISIMMPVNTRPREWFYDVIGMYALFESVSTRSADRTDPETTLATVAAQTTEIKENDREAAFLESLRLIPPGTPVGIKRWMPNLLDGPGERLLDTAILSNLGRVPEPLPALDGESPEALWFTPPSWKPTPVGVGVATVDGTVFLGFRYMHSVFDEAAAEAFADSYHEVLSELV